MATFGNEVATTEYQPWLNKDMRASKFTLSENAVLSTITAYFRSTSTPRDYVCAVYADDTGVPTTQLALSDSVTVSVTSAAWRDFTISVELAAGVYWLMLTPLTDSNFGFWYVAGDANQGVRKNQEVPRPTDPFGTPSAWLSYAFSIYATYTPVAGGLSSPVAMHHYTKNLRGI